MSSETPTEARDEEARPRRPAMWRRRRVLTATVIAVALGWRERFDG
jgi:hypothetical protein